MLKIRPVTDDDCRLLWEWLNEPKGRVFAFTPEDVPWEKHLAWFRRKMSDPSCFIFVLTNESASPVGQVRLEIGPDNSAVIGLTIASDYRGLGYGTEAIRLVCDHLRRNRSAREATAYIKPSNASSIRAFQKAGFVHQGKRPVRGQEAVWMNLQIAS
jgi:UDP-2,4-diacetamido-2,4,6-trideoxy-beta-L-altropyranose hydrolase